MIARLPSLNGLRAFEAAARHLSFTVAASFLLKGAAVTILRLTVSTAGASFQERYRP